MSQERAGPRNLTYILTNYSPCYHHSIAHACTVCHLSFVVLTVPTHSNHHRHHTPPRALPLRERTWIAHSAPETDDSQRRCLAQDSRGLALPPPLPPRMEPLLTVCAWLRDHSHFYGRGRIPHFHGAKRNRQRIRARRLLCMSLSSVRPLLHARYARCVVTSPGKALARYRQRTLANPAVMKNVWSYQQK